MTLSRNKIIFATTVLIAVFTFLYFFTGVFGDTRIGVTITTNPDLERGLVGHWTFDGSVSTQISDRSGSGNDGYFSEDTPHHNSDKNGGKAISRTLRQR